ncbi:MAG TPA: hypothetical protein VFM34_08045 [Moraxellaceae bacterium]|nr:hypothetical protein [Moraxellaceae bacterium]
MSETSADEPDKGRNGEEHTDRVRRHHQPHLRSLPGALLRHTGAV